MAVPNPEISRVYQDGPFLWVPEGHLNALGYKGARVDLIVSLPGPAPDGHRSPYGEIEHLYELQGYDAPRQRWWIKHLCCFTHSLPDPVAQKALPPAPKIVIPVRVITAEVIEEEEDGA